ncbi:D-methionine transport system ATP-binding protein [Propionibacterium cyclohexanicum]|uniref:D-methionine transport system ATP-binding protein n=1 Tax=Propionibacterium cyclohexanicum TaxID=64702 RepID=A0A1H9RY52_9ACTN|nr:D-methionine transport system ATP-binding protein [Propionibacterium cyclohexanicum]
MTTQIAFHNAGKVFQTSSGPVTALEKIDLEIDKGEIFAVIGYSGAGKSTLVRLINGLERVTQGTVFVNGIDITHLPEGKLRSVRREIGMIFQQFNLMRSKTVYGNIAYPLKLAKWSKADIQARVTELLSFVGLTSKAWVYPDQLSGGQKQRVGIARALATRPSVLLADESTSALDPETTQDVLALLRRVNEELGVTIVVITHEMEVVRAIADRVAVLDSGQLIEGGSVDEIFENPKAATTRRFVNTITHYDPEPGEIERLQAARPGATLVSIRSVDPAEFGRCLAVIGADSEVSFEIVRGGIVQVKTRSIGSFTVALDGPAGAVARAETSLREVAGLAEELTRGEHALDTPAPGRHELGEEPDAPIGAEK